VRQILEEIKPQLLEILQLKLWPTGHLPFFRAKVEKAQQRIEACRSQAPLKADIFERCRLLNNKKVALDAKADTSAHSQRLQSLERELKDLKAKVRATEQCIQDEKDLIAHSQQEAENLTAQLKTELIELSVLSRQIVSGEDKDDEAVIVEADRVHLEALYSSHVSRCRLELACIPITLLKSMVIHQLFDQLSVLGTKYFLMAD
jgi:DNA repair exonuclease SbcCD ATPase subunit